MEKLIIDRIEEGIALCEKDDMTHCRIAISTLPFDVCEGSVLLYDGEKFLKDETEEQLRRERILKLQNNILKKGKK